MSHEFSRYHRQMLLPGVGAEGQRRLAASHAVIVGVGALGCASADLLVRAGVGRVTLMDRDVVEMTNLQRQTLFDEGDVGVPKAEAAARRLARVNSQAEIVPMVADVSARSVARLLGLGEGGVGATRGDVIVDGCDNFETRYLLNDVSVKVDVPYVYGGVVGTRGMQATFLPRAGPCLRCVFPELPPVGSVATCDTAGVLGPAVAIVAAAQAADVLKILLGQSAMLSGELLEFDLWTSNRRSLDLRGMRADDCVCCGLWRFEFLDSSGDGDGVSLCGADSVQIVPRASGSGVIDLDALAARLGAIGRVTRSRFMVRAAVAEGIELSVFADGRAIVRGTSKADVARGMYAKFVGS
jgi:molybdopterin-synthase adenylyltransferase